MIVIAFIFLFAAAVVSRLKALLVFGLCYTAMQAAHHFLLDGGSAIYSASAVTIDFVSLIGLAVLSVKFQTKWQLLPLSIIMFVSIINGYYGMVAYKTYADVELLNTIGLCVYACVIAGLLWSHHIGKFAGVGGDTRIRNRSPLWRLDSVNEGGE